VRLDVAGGTPAIEAVTVVVPVAVGVYVKTPVVVAPEFGPPSDGATFQFILVPTIVCPLAWTVYVIGLPAETVDGAGVSVILVGGAAVTVSTAEPDAVPDVPVMVVWPTPMAVIAPELALIVATDVADDVHVTGRFGGVVVAAA
jgi:hypothetical protein